MQKIVESVFYCPLVSGNIRYMQSELSLFLSAQSGISRKCLFYDYRHFFHGSGSYKCFVMSCLRDKQIVVVTKNKNH